MFLCVIFLLGAGILAAQQFTSVSGLVVDPTGAVVPGARLTLESLTRGTMRTATSDREGRYVFAQVQPDRYKLTARSAGFTDVIVNELVLQVNTPASVEIRFEKIGAVAETISVTGEAALVSTTDATLGNTINMTAITQLPFFARNVVNLLALQPGVTVSGSVNGGKPDQGNVTLDGIDVNDQMERNAFTSVLGLTLDSVQEFRTTTSNANADQGRSSGAQVALITRSGSNDFHGSLYHYHRNTVHAANSFFNNTSRVKRPALLINIPGGSFGGRIVPNKLFFFVNYEERRDASSSNVQRTVPTDTFRQGIVQYRRAGGGGIVQLSPAQIRQLDPAGIGASAAALQVFQSYPQANALEIGDGLNFAGYRFTAPIAQTVRTYT
ncbi:MAG: carboxypeptidase regulatory-like domain-containing protein, partial [Bryobacteraceae bacterium]